MVNGSTLDENIGGNTCHLGWGYILKQTIEKSIYKDCGEGKVLIRLKIQS